MNGKYPYPIEGDFIETKHGHFFEVKGFHQPYPQEDFMVGYIRYAKKNEQFKDVQVQKDKINIEDRGNHLKVYSIKDKMSFIQNFISDYTYKTERYYFPMQAIPLIDIKRIHRADKFLETYIELKNQSHMQNERNWKGKSNQKVLKDAVDLCKLLSQGSGVPLKYFGITGSLLINTGNPQSDIDLIVYGFGNSLNVREYIHNCFRNADVQKKSKNGNMKCKDLSRYKMKELKQLYKFRAKKSPISFFDFLKYEIRKYHQGTFRKRDFFIRYLEHPTREEYRNKNLFFKRKIIALGRITVTGQVRDDKNWWTTPARVGIANSSVVKKDLKKNYKKILQSHNLKLEQIYQTFTLRGRYTENVRLLEYFKTQGTLELVKPYQKQAYLQIGLGNNPGDFLMPI